MRGKSTAILYLNRHRRQMAAIILKPNCRYCDESTSKYLTLSKPIAIWKLGSTSAKRTKEFVWVVTTSQKDSSSSIKTIWTRLSERSPTHRSSSPTNNTCGGKENQSPPTTSKNICENGINLHPMCSLGQSIAWQQAHSRCTHLLSGTTEASVDNSYLLSYLDQSSSCIHKIAGYW